MIRASVVVDSPEGLHARPCSQIAQVMKRFRGRLEIHAQGQKADARSVLELMTLAAAKGTKLDLVASGDDARALLDAVLDLFRSGFGGARGG